MRHKHHIVPKHAGGTDDPDNLVELTPMEHAEAHHLLWCLHKNPFDKMAWLTLSGSVGKEDIISMKLSAAGKKAQQFIDYAKRGEKLRGSNNGMFNMTGEKNHFFGKKHSEQKRKEISEATKAATPDIECEHCGKLANTGNYKRWHGDNCKLK